MHNLALSFQLAGSSFLGVINYLLSLINILNPILFTLAFLIFFWGLSKFILSSGSKDEVQKGKDYMLWGIAALFILLSFMAIINLASNDLGFGGVNGTPPQLNQNAN